MKTQDSQPSPHHELILVLGGTGKTGRRVAARLQESGIRIRIGSRSAIPAFDWHDESGWDSCLQGVSAVYVNYLPDLAIPGATDSIAAFVDKARAHGVHRLVLLSGRGEPEAQACERIVQESGLEWTIVRASWFNQNFSEGAFIQMVKCGQITLPAGAVGEPFVDVDDIADVATAALVDSNHVGVVYEVTGPRLLTFAEVAAELSSATGREICYQQIPQDSFVNSVRESGAPEDVVWIMDYLFATVLDGRNAHLTDGVQRALGRPPKDFSEYARHAAKTGIWEEATFTAN